MLQNTSVFLFGCFMLGLPHSQPFHNHHALKKRNLIYCNQKQHSYGNILLIINMAPWITAVAIQLSLIFWELVSTKTSFIPKNTHVDQSISKATIADLNYNILYA